MEKGGSSWKDRLGIAASMLCAIHCAATPFLLAFLPTLQFTEWMASPQFHQLGAILCVSLVAISIWPAFHRFRDYRVLGLSTAGLLLILGAAFLLPNCCCTDFCCTSTDSQAMVASTDHYSGDGRQTGQNTGTKIEPLGVASIENDLFDLAGTDHPIWSMLLPWMTPIGGLLLIAAHFLNLRRGLGVCSARCVCNVTLAEVTELSVSQAA